MAIELLSRDVAAKIAAGEVVERPANVAKELIENSLDAGASEVRVEIRQGGQRLLRVSDDGHGIPANELELAVARHATSKLRSAADLDAIRTLGFRGEALYSIAAVSRMTLSSRARASDAGAEVLVEGGNLQHVRSAGLPVGAVVTVENIFFNLPARRKFLRRPAAEASRVAAIVQRYALACPACRFHYFNEGKLAFSTDGNGRVIDVLTKIYGRESAQQLISVGPMQESSGSSEPGERLLADRDGDAQGEVSFMPGAAPSSTGPQAGARVAGYVSQPSLTRASRAQIDLFVNRRYVEDRALAHAVVQAYHTLLPPGRYPLALLFVELEAADVDVNVHPRKTEVRFANARAVFSAVQRAVRQAVVEGAGVPDMPPRNDTSQAFAGASQSGWAARRQSILDAGSGRQPLMPVDLPHDRTQDAHPLPDLRRAQAHSGNTTAAEQDVRDAPAGADQGLPPLRVVGQAAAMYVIAEGPEGLYLIDQHAAHERILYEKFMAQRHPDGPPATARQGLLEPIALHVGDVRAGLVAQHLAELKAVGFNVEHFGGDTFLVRAVPSALSHQDCERVLDEIVQGLAENRDLVGEELEARLVKMVCKRASIKAGQILSDIEMKELVRQLEQCAAPRTCPHGRPTMLQLRAGELERAFKRT